MFEIFRKEKFPADVLAADSAENTVMEDAGEQSKKKSFRFRMSTAFAFALCVMLALSRVTSVLAADSSTSSVLDFSLASKLVDLIKAVNVLFTLEPINYYLIGALILLVLRIFRGAKKTATK